MHDAELRSTLRPSLASLHTSALALVVILLAVSAQSVVTDLAALEGAPALARVRATRVVRGHRLGADYRVTLVYADPAGRPVEIETTVPKPTFDRLGPGASVPIHVFGLAAWWPHLDGEPWGSGLMIAGLGALAIAVLFERIVRREFARRG